jgi:hypothetical protein
VDDLNRGYSISPDYEILPCWPAHPGLVEELAALHSAWIAATIGPAGRWHPPDGVVAPERYLVIATLT